MRTGFVHDRMTGYGKHAPIGVPLQNSSQIMSRAAASGFLLVIVFSGTWTSFLGEPGVECLHLMAQCDSGEGEQSWLTCCLYCFRRCIIPEYRST